MIAALPATLGAQDPVEAALVRVSVYSSAEPLAGAVVRALNGALETAAPTDASGMTTLRLAAGDRSLLTTRIGYMPDTLRVSLRPGQDTAIVVPMSVQTTEMESIVVTATRAERRVEDTPLRVEVIDEEEVAEKVAMTPGDIAMMLNETSGLRVQTTNPSLGGANVRIQGLRGRYSLILADGLPLYGGQPGGLGLLQIPPVDLAHVEIIKGTASALYGSAALGGVINLVSRKPGDVREHTILVNGTSRGGTDAVAFGGGPVSDAWGYTLLAGAHRQRQNDLDDDGWTDMPGYERLVVRPRFYFDNGGGGTAFVTLGATGEDRDGGTISGRTLPGGASHAERLRTRRFDAGALARKLFAGGAIASARASAADQRHAHRFGNVTESDVHRTLFGEASVAVPRGRGVLVLGAALQHESYRNDDVARFDYDYLTPAAFVQADADLSSWISASATVRADAHSEYGTFLNPRVSLLLRDPRNHNTSGWTMRVSGGTAAFAPTPFTEETEATGLTPLVSSPGLVAERAHSASLDVGGPIDIALGDTEINVTAFASRVSNPLQILAAPGTTPDGASRITLGNASGSTATLGGELLARIVRPLGTSEEGPRLRVTASYTHLRSTECSPGLTGCQRREVPLTPRHAAGVVASVEREGISRVGVELYYTGVQPLEENPWREASRPYVLLGLLGERAIRTRAGVTRLFLNLENLTDVRQTRFDPLLLPARGQGGRWTTDAWTDLNGFTANGGMRLTF